VASQRWMVCDASSIENSCQMLVLNKRMVRDRGYVGLMWLLERPENPSTVSGSCDRQPHSSRPQLSTSFLLAEGRTGRTYHAFPVPSLQSPMRLVRGYVQGQRSERFSSSTLYSWTGYVTLPHGGSKIMQVLGPFENTLRLASVIGSACRDCGNNRSDVRTGLRTCGLEHQASE
jgi:hypothetical protein